MIGKKKIFLFDIDNTICVTTNKKYNKSKPIKSIVKKINLLKENGHIIKIFTARYMGRNKENFTLVKKKYFNRVNKQLKKWGVNFDELILGKPSYDYFIDDKCYNVKDKETNSILNKYIIKKK